MAHCQVDVHVAECFVGGNVEMFNLHSMERHFLRWYNGPGESKCEETKIIIQNEERSIFHMSKSED